MRTIDLLRLIFDNLRRQKGRVLLTAIGVVIGTAALVMLVSLANGLQQSTMQQFTSNGQLMTIYVYPGDQSMMQGNGMVVSQSGGSSQSRQGLLTNKTIEQIKQIPGVKTVIIRIWLESYGILRTGKLENGMSIIGVDKNDVSLLDVRVDQGSTILERGSAILGGTAAKNFYETNPRPGMYEPQAPEVLDKRLKLRVFKYTDQGEVTKDLEIKIVGITEETMSEYDYALIIPLADVESLNEWVRGQRINRNVTGYSELLVKVDDINQVLDIADTIQEMGYQAMSPMTYIKDVQNTFTIMQLVFGGIGAISLLVAAIGIANTMTMAILERTHEIGLMKAIGATNSNILSIFLGESASIGFVGGATGTLLGWGLGKAFSTFSGALGSFLPVPTSPDGSINLVNTPPWLVIFAIGFATLIGLLSGLYPSIRAATMEPVVALKHE